MAKDTYYFSHDYNARNDEKILELRVKYGAEGYGLFWMLVETMAENENGGAKASLIGGLSLGYGVAKEKLLEFIDYCIDIELFYKEEGFIFSRRMKKHKDFRLKLSEKGKEGAEKRWKNSPPIGEGNAKEKKGKEIKGKENKELYNWESDKKSFLNAGDWIFKFCTDKKIPLDEFEKKANEFISDTELREDFKPLTELRKHFTNWFNLKNSKVNGHHRINGRELSTVEKELELKRQKFKGLTEQ